MPDQRSVMKEFRFLDEKRLAEGLTPTEEARHARLRELIGPEGAGGLRGGFDVTAAAARLRESLLPAGLRNRPPPPPPEVQEAAPEVPPPEEAPPPDLGEDLAATAPAERDAFFDPASLDALAEGAAARESWDPDAAPDAPAPAAWDPNAPPADAGALDPEVPAAEGGVGHEATAPAAWDPNVPYDPSAQPTWDPNVPYDPSAQPTWDPNVPYDPSAQATWDPNVPYDPNAQATWDPNVPYDPSAQATWDPNVPYDPSAQATWDPNVPYDPSAQAPVDPNAPYDPNAQAPVDPNAPYDPNAQAAWDPNVPYDPNAQAAWDPNVPYDPNAQAAWDPNVPYDPNAQAAWDPNVPYDPSAQAAWDPNVPYDPNAQAPVDPDASYDPNAQAAWDPNVPYDPSARAASDPNVAFDPNDPQARTGEAGPLDPDALPTPEERYAGGAANWGADACLAPDAALASAAIAPEAAAGLERYAGGAANWGADACLAPDAALASATIAPEAAAGLERHAGSAEPLAAAGGEPVDPYVPEWGSAAPDGIAAAAAGFAADAEATLEPVPGDAAAAYGDADPSADAAPGDASFQDDAGTLPPAGWDAEPAPLETTHAPPSALGEYDETASSVGPVPPEDATLDSLFPLEPGAPLAADAPEGAAAPLGEYDDTAGFGGAYLEVAPEDLPQHGVEFEAAQTVAPAEAAGWAPEAALDEGFTLESGGSFDAAASGTAQWAAPAAEPWEHEAAGGAAPLAGAEEGAGAPAIEAELAPEEVVELAAELDDVPDGGALTGAAEPAPDLADAFAEAALAPGYATLEPSDALAPEAPGEAPQAEPLESPPALDAPDATEVRPTAALAVAPDLATPEPSQDAAAADLSFEISFDQEPEASPPGDADAEVTVALEALPAEDAPPPGPAEAPFEDAPAAAAPEAAAIEAASPLPGAEASPLEGASPPAPSEAASPPASEEGPPADAAPAPAGLVADEDIPTIEGEEILEEIPLEEIAAPAFVVPGVHRVVVHTVEGQVKRGVLEDAALDAAALALAPAAGGGTEAVAVDRVKAIFFMLAPGEDAPVAEGKKVRVTFRDGRQIAGFSPDYREDGPGFFVVPGDTRTSTGRIWVYRAAVRQVAVS